MGIKWSAINVFLKDNIILILKTVLNQIDSRVPKITKILLVRF